VTLCLWCWAQWGGKNEAQVWIRKRLSTSKGFLNLVKYFCKNDRSDETSVFAAKDLSDLISLGEVVRARRKHFPRTVGYKIPELVARFDYGIKMFQKQRRGKNKVDSNS
jgi:hypothetical protein